MDWAEACRILGVSEAATDTEIRDQYIYKAQLLHPDKNQDKPENIRIKAEGELALVNQAYTFLVNPNNNPYKIPPKLAIEPTAIRFKDISIGERKSTTLTIRSVGGPYTSIWIDNQPAPWLTVTNVKSITSERLPLEVTLESTGIGEPGNRYICDLSIKLENENTHIVDHGTIKIELYLKSDSVGVGIKKEGLTSAESSGAVITRNKPAAQPAQKNKIGFSFGAFMVNLLAFAVTGIIAFYLIRNFFSSFTETYVMGFFIGSIVYASVALGLSVNHGFTVGSKTAKTKAKIR